MNILKKIGIVSSMAILVSLIIIFQNNIANVSAKEPGDENDPVVTKSYVDMKIKYVPLKIEKNQKLIGKEGTEIIVRSGETRAIANGANGIADLTIGVDIKNHEMIKLNHALVIPRSDGRGIIADTLTWVLIRGEYEIK